MAQLLEPVLNLFRFHKLKMFVVLLFASIFAIWIFPSGDLSDLVSDRATRATGIYMQLDGLGLAFNPAPGIHADNLVVEPPDLPPLKVESADIFVSILNAIMGKQAASAQLAGLFKGDVSVDFSEGDKLKSGERIKNVVVSTNKLDLSDVTDYLGQANMLALSLKGALTMNSTLHLDPTFAEQPSGQVGMEIGSFMMPSQMVPTQMGPLQTPPLQLGKVTMKADMKDGNLELQEFNFGGAKDGIAGKVHGQIQMRMQRMGPNVSPQIGTYKLAVDLTIPKSFLSANPTMGTAFSLLEGMGVGRFKKETSTEVKYVFAATGTPGGIPSFTDKL